MHVRRETIFFPLLFFDAPFDSCYLNATVQQLFNVQPFVSGILSAATPKKDSGKLAVEAAARNAKLAGLTSLSNVLRRVVADPVESFQPRYDSTLLLSAEFLKKIFYPETYIL